MANGGVLTVWMAVLLLGCAVDAPVVERRYVVLPGFDAERHLPYAGRGPGRIEGQGFLRQRGGGVVTCAGAPVMLVPATAYFETMFAQLQSGAVPEPGASVPPEANVLRRTTMCDAQGNFVLDGLPIGRWLLMTDVTWAVAGRQQGGTLRRLVNVRDEPVKALLSDSDLSRR